MCADRHTLNELTIDQDFEDDTVVWATVSKARFSFELNGEVGAGNRFNEGRRSESVIFSLVFIESFAIYANHDVRVRKGIGPHGN